MIGLDTNVLVRYLIQDDAGQARRADTLIEGMLDRGDRGVVSIVALCELVWVLRDAYDLDRTTVASTLERVLDTAEGKKS